jgi:hypothetical protein
MRFGLVAVLSVLASFALAACTSEISLLSKPETTGSAPAGPAGISGGVLSGAIGQNLGEEDRQRAYAAEMQALESGEPGIPVGWRALFRPWHALPGLFPLHLCRRQAAACARHGLPQCGRELVAGRMGSLLILNGFLTPGR